MIKRFDKKTLSRNTVRFGISVLTALMIAAIPSMAENPAAMQITTGLTAHQVIQCADAPDASLAIGGTVQTGIDGAVNVRVVHLAEGTMVIQAVNAGVAKEGVWSAAIPALPPGGPYRVECRVVDEQGAPLAECSVDDVLAGDLWIMAGQSNMHGRGYNIDVEKPDPKVHVFAMNDQWRLAEEPIHRLDESVDAVHNPKAAPGLVADRTGWTRDASLGLAFAKEWVRRTGQPVGLVPCAHGGTSIEQWDPALKDRGGDSLYGAMYRRFQSIGGDVRGVLWYQGENNTQELENAQAYHDKFIDFVNAVRTDFNAPELPFIFVQLGRRLPNDKDPAAWNTLQIAQLQAESELSHVRMAATVDLPLDDYIHISTQGLKTLGKRLVYAALADNNVLSAGPRFSSVQRVKTPYDLQVHVKLTGVNQGLTPNEQLHGFSIHDAAGNELPVIYHQEVGASPDTVVLHVQSLPEQAWLWYGHGVFPICTVTDSQNMALPVFGPVPVTE
ncbi:MAG: sialate O-acetylesterase [Candidatus Hydrogenedentes bacterium]|nr:sialate O-acetylesterase [Candidatus Hydrogenedentota bacterium]